ncbi:hypothetical protein [Candidatus Oscillochloris fontis]|uniref:hypothetical protein n=1 Tax=Candidatus Oscillochloris fontis TaxID=2496868 RepID=UPI00101D6822|nr:hypothetical protein [Candidatus Oscillochloris fontis]
MWMTLLLAIVRSILIWIWLACKPVLGWFLIIIGLIGIPMPIVNGLIFLMLGIALVGPRNRIIRWSRVHLKLFLYRWAALPTPLIGTLGRIALNAARQVSRQHRRLRWWWMSRPRHRAAA